MQLWRNPLLPCSADDIMTFAASVNCIDGRVQKPITEYIKRKCTVDFVDVITIPGCARVLAEQGDDAALKLVRRSVEVSIAKHGSKYVFVSGHYDCAANPVDRKKHVEQIKEAAALIRSWNSSIQVVCLWVGGNLQVEEIT